MPNHRTNNPAIHDNCNYYEILPTTLNVLTFGIFITFEYILKYSPGQNLPQFLSMWDQL